MGPYPAPWGLLQKSVQRMPTRMMKCLEGKPYKKWLRPLGLFNLEKKRLRGDLTAVCKFLMRERRGGGTDIFTVVASDRIWVNDIKLSEGRFRLDIREMFFTQIWNSEVTTPSLSSRSAWIMLSDPWCDSFSVLCRDRILPQWFLQVHSLILWLSDSQQLLLKNQEFKEQWTHWVENDFWWSLPGFCRDLKPFGIVSVFRDKWKNHLK